MPDEDNEAVDQQDIDDSEHLTPRAEIQNDSINWSGIFCGDHHRVSTSIYRSDTQTTTFLLDIATSTFNPFAHTPTPVYSVVTPGPQAAYYSLAHHISEESPNSDIKTDEEFEMPALVEWKTREATRMADRRSPVWVNEPFWMSYAARHKDHFVHVSTANSRLLAYTQDATKGRRDIQTPIKPGKYLTTYFSDVLSEKRIAFLASWQILGQQPMVADADDVVLYATTPDDIARVYTDGPTSCMSGKNFKNLETHPARVYGAGDLAIAYIVRAEDIVARCLVWPEKKIAGRVYPTPDYWREDDYTSVDASEAMQQTMRTVLKRDGYTFIAEDGSLDGARLLKIPHTNTKGKYSKYLMPYLDNDYCIKEDETGEYFLMNEDECGDGVYGAQDTSGLICINGKGGSYDFNCYACDDGLNDEDSIWVHHQCSGTEVWEGNRWCEPCAGINAFRCAIVGEYLSLQHIERVFVTGIGLVNRAWADMYCYQSSHSRNWFRTEFNPPVELYNGDLWEQGEFGRHGFVCPITLKNYRNTERHPLYPELSPWVTSEQINEWLLARYDAEQNKEAA